MQITGQHMGAQEQIFARMRIVAHAWKSVVDFGAVGMNYSGMLVSIQNDAAQLESGRVEPGMGCVIGTPTEYITDPVGINVTEMIGGRDPMSGRGVWITVQTYGHCERILTAGSSVDTNDRFLVSATSDAGFLRGLTALEATSIRPLLGKWSIEMVGTILDTDYFTIDLSGAIIPRSMTAGTLTSHAWNVSPSKGNIGSSEQYASAAVVGYHYENDTEKTPDEVRDGKVPWNSGYRQVRGFIKCMGTGGSGKG